MRSDGCIGVLVADLALPTCRSLKDKRAPLASLRDTLRVRFRCSFSEVGFQDVRQRARVLVVLASSSLQQARERLDEVDRYLRARDFEVAQVRLKTVDTVASLWDIDS